MILSVRTNTKIDIYVKPVCYGVNYAGEIGVLRVELVGWLFVFSFVLM